MLRVSEKVKKNLSIAVVVILVVIVGKGMFFPRKAKEIKNKEAKVINRIGDSAWVKVNSVAISDIVAMEFDKSGKYGAAISLEGSLIKSIDGGESWFGGGVLDLVEGELVNGLGVGNDGKVVVGTSVDDSSYTGLYREISDGKYNYIACNNCGGILAMSSDGEIAVGGAGLIAKFNTQLNKWEFSYLPDSMSFSLYGVSKNENKVYITGENGLVGISSDYGKTWESITINTVVKSSLPFYSISSLSIGALIGSKPENKSENLEILMVGGVNGRLLLNKAIVSREPINSNNWIEVKGLSKEQKINTLLVTEKVFLAAGGKLSGVDGFIIGSSSSSKSNIDSHISDINDPIGDIWFYDRLPKGISSIVSIKVSNKGLIAASSDGNILRKVKNKF